MPLAEIKSERERMETKGSGLIKRSDKRALLLTTGGLISVRHREFI